MGIRFRKSIKIVPGIRVNVSKTGLSSTVGPRGASVSLKRGKRAALNVGLGGGLSARYGGGSSTSRRPSGGVSRITIVIVITAAVIFAAYLMLR